MRLINRCLNKQLLEICQRSMQHDKLSEQITKFLPEELRAHCRMGSFNQGTLVLMAENASWATKLRFMLPELRDKLRTTARVGNLRQIKINMLTPDTPQSPSPLLDSKTNGQNKIQYEPLRAALKKLVPTDQNSA